MKQTYFTPDTINQKAIEMIQEVGLLRKRTDIVFSPERSALLVLDMQAYFLDSASHAFIPSASAIVPGLQALIETYSNRDLPIIFTRHQNTPQDAGQMAAWWRELMLPDHPSGGVIPELDTSKGLLLSKCQYDAFYNTGLEAYLRSRDVLQVIISGVMTHLCCETTARSAFMRGFEVFFLVDGTATYNERFHIASLLNLSHGFATLALVEEVLKACHD
ncbi:MAG: isochorismatase family protein [Chloroflexota bacterium]|nr:MAG: isochorismatase family protein [Chloroflexota bacterium]